MIPSARAPSRCASDTSEHAQDYVTKATAYEKCPENVENQIIPVYLAQRFLLELMLSLKLSDLNALCFATKNIPDRTPKRWDLVSKFVSDNTDESSPEIQVLLSGGSEIRTIQHTPTHFREFYRSLCQSWPVISQCSEAVLHRLGAYPDKSGLKHLVLLPAVQECCSTTTVIRNRPSFPLVYTTQGTFVAAMYIAECKRCSKKISLQLLS